MSTPDPRIEAIFHEALERPPTEREAFVAQACAEDENLLRELQRLLAAHDDAGPYFESPNSPEIEAELARLKPEEASESIGPYKLLEQIGEGGFGTVWIAEQKEPVRRRVALKILKLGMDTKEVLARFEQERQALALMDHPSIARVFDAGATQHGRPFIVMELVGGVKITEYCDAHHLAMRERLELFMAVCQAVQHAHQKGLIHRDLKPSNILVTLQDGVPVPKIIDFGVAKAVQQRLSDLTVYTQIEQMIGTPPYMSPEQAEASALNVDTRTDIYALGVLLYELLTGRTPFDAATLMKASYEEMRRIIREQEPPKPSTALHTMAANSLTDVARHRQSEPPALIHAVRGDLDWIVMKALEKERTRRYETANGFALDVQRHLRCEPVVARPPSGTYRFGRLVRRNRLVFAAAGAVAAALIIGLSVAVISLSNERKARAGEAEQRTRATRHAAEAMKAVTRLEIERAESLFAADNSSRALAYLARLLRQQPTNRVVAERLLSALSQRNFCLPIAPALKHDEPARAVTESESNPSARFLGAVHVQDLVRAANFSPDGQRLVTAGKDGTARIWDGRSGLSVCPPLQHTGEVMWAQFSPDGEWVITASMDRTARLWNAQNGQPKLAPLHHQAPVLYADFSPDSRQAVTVSQDGMVQIWDTGSGQPSPDPVKKPGAYYAGFSPDGTQLLIGAQPVFRAATSNAFVVDANTRRDVASFRHFFDIDGEKYFPQFSVDGQQVVSADGGHNFILSPITPNGASAFQLRHNRIPTAARFSPDGRTIATASWDGSARLWDTRTGAALAAPLLHGDRVLSLGFSPDGLRLITASRDQFTRLWDVTSGKTLAEPIRHGSEVKVAQFGGDGMHFVTIAGGKTASLWEIRSAQAGIPLPSDGSIHHAVFSRDGRRIATVSEDGTARVRDARTGEPVTRPMKQNPALHFVEFSPDGQRLATGSFYSAAYIWDLSGPVPVPHTLPHPASVYSIRFNADGQRVVTACRDGAARVWDAVSIGRLITLQHGDQVTYAEFSPDGRRIVTASWDGTARVWDAETGELLLPPLRHEAEVLWAVFSPDGQLVATASRDKTVRLWSTRTGQMSAKPLSHSDELLRDDPIHFNWDGSQIATGAGNTAQIWNTRDSQPATPPLKHGAKVHSVRFNPDGTRMITSCDDNTARIWDVASGHAISELLSHGSNHAEFSPDGQRVVAAGRHGARVWDVPAIPVPVPDWLPDLAEAVAGQRIDEQEISVGTGTDELFQLRQRLGDAKATDFYDTWAKWFFAEGATRKISPWSAMTVPGYVQRLIEDDTLESLREAVKVSPTNALALSRLAAKVLAQDAAQNPRQSDEADWYNRLASALAPTGTEGSQAVADLAASAAMNEPVVATNGPPAVTLENFIASIDQLSALDEQNAQRILAGAALQVWSGRYSDHLTTSQRVLKLAAGTEIAAVASRAARVYCLRPSTDPLLMDSAIALARKAVLLGQGRPSLPWYQLTLGMAEYRQSNYPEANKELDAAKQGAENSSGRMHVYATAGLFHAMSLFRQGNEPQARECFAQAEAKMKLPPDDDKDPLAGGVDYNDLILWLAYKEAKALLQSK